MPESLIALGILVVVAILLDGLRRMRNARRDSFQLARDLNCSVNRDELDELGNDFPSGSARVVAHRSSAEDEQELQEDTNLDMALADTGRRNIDFNQAAPILLDVKEEQRQRIEPELFSDADGDIDSKNTNSQKVDDETESYIDSRTQNDSVPMARGVRNPSPVFDTATTPLGLGESEILGEPRVYERPVDQPIPRREQPVKKPSKPVIQAREERAQSSTQSAPLEPKNQTLPFDDLIIIGVMARERGGFNGAALLDVLLHCGLRYGHYGFFHYYIGEERENESLFSVTNIVNPGAFDLNRMDELQTPGISMFLSMSAVHGNAMEVFDRMLDIARTVAEKLNGELRDERRSVMTNQTVEHNRQRIRDFEMQSRLRAR